MPTLTLTPDPDSTPPSVFVEVAGDIDQVVSSVALTRDGVPVLGSALAGFEKATYTDYSAPYGQLCSYRAVGVTSERTWPALWSEAWADLAEWVAGDWSVAAGVAFSDAVGHTLTRAAANFGKVTVADPQYVRLELLDAASAVVGSVACTSSIVVAGVTSETIAAVDDFAAWIIGDTLFVATGAESASVPISGLVASVRLVAIPAAANVSSWSSVNGCYAIGAAGDFVYTSANETVVRKYSTSGSQVASWTRAHTSDSAAGIAADPDGSIYLLERGSRYIDGAWVNAYWVTKYGSAGAVLASWNFTAPSGDASCGIAVDGTHVYVSTGPDDTIRKFTKDAGVLATSWVCQDAQYVAVGPSGNIYVGTGGNRMVRVYTPAGVYVDSWTYPVESGSRVASDGIYIFMGGATVVTQHLADGTMVYSWPVTSLSAIAASGDFVYTCAYMPKTITKWEWKQARVGALATFTAATTTTADFDVLADTILDSETAWLIHPKTPALSVQIAIGYSPTAAAFIDKKGIGDSIQAAQSTKQRAAGASADAVFTVGPRSARATSLRLFTRTAAGASAMNSLLNDESPILPLFPKSWRVPLESRWYAVGDVAESYVGPRSDARKWSLPLTPAAIPYVIVQPVWNWATLILAYPTWADVIAAFATDYDMMINNPRA